MTNTRRPHGRAFATLALAGGLVLAGPGLSANAAMSLDGSGLSGAKTVTLVGPTDAGATVVVSPVVAQIQRDYIQSAANLDGQIETPAGVYAGNDTDTIQAWDMVENPVTVTPEHTAIDVGDSQLSAVDGDGGGCLGWNYDIDRSYSYKRTLRNRGTTYSLNNTTNSPGSISVSHAQTMSASVTISASAEVEAGVIISKVKATFGLSVTASYSWTTEVGYSITAAPHRFTHLSGAVLGYTTKGHYYHENSKCVIDDDKGTVTAFTPVPRSDVYNAWSEASV